MSDRRPLRRLPVLSLLLVQLACGLGAALLLWTLAGPLVARSVAIGVLIAWLPNLYFAHKMFRFSGARAAQAIVRSFYVGEAGKLVLTAVLFTLTFVLVKGVQPLALFGGFFVVQSAGWFAPLLVNTDILRP